MGGVVDSIGGLFGGDATGGAARDASQAQYEGLRDAIDALRGGFNAQTDLYGFQRGIGNQALAQLGGLYGLQAGYDPGGSIRYNADGTPAFTPGSMPPGGGATPNFAAFFNSPDYQYALSEGLGAVDARAGAMGNLFSGGRATALNEKAQGLASQNFGNYFNRLSSLAGIGTQSTNALSNALGGTVQSIADAHRGIGDARASGYINQANANQNALGQWLGFAGNLFGGGGGG